MFKNKKMIISYIIIVIILTVTIVVGIVENPNFTIHDFFMSLAAEFLGLLFALTVVEIYIHEKRKRKEEKDNNRSTETNKTNKKFNENWLPIIIDLVDKLKIKYVIEGGWGVDIIYGKKTREHRDLDIDVDINKYKLLVDELKEIGFEDHVDELPVRIELFHNDIGFIDIHPIRFKGDGTAIQAIPEFGDVMYKKEWFIKKDFKGRKITCLSKEAQQFFHTGYELREIDKQDLKVIDSLKD